MGDQEHNFSDITPEELEFFEKGANVPEGAEEAEEEPEAETAEAETDEPEKEGEEDAEEEKPETQGKEPKGYVKLAALHEAREENRRLRESVEREQARVAQFESLKAQLEEMRNQRSYQDQTAMEEEARRAQQQAEEMYQEDPVGYLKNQNMTLAQQMEAIRQQQEQFVQAQQQSIQEAAQMRQLTEHVNGLEAQFRQEVPEYDDAFQFLQQRRLADYAAIGIVDPNEQRASLYREILGMSGKAIQDGKNPAEVLYSLAKNWGFTPKSEQSEGEPNKEATGKIDRLQRGMKTATTLSDSGGAPPGGEISLSDIERMSDDEFEKLWSDMEKNAG